MIKNLYLLLYSNSNLVLSDGDISFYEFIGYSKLKIPEAAAFCFLSVGLI